MFPDDPKLYLHETQKSGKIMFWFKTKMNVCHFKRPSISSQAYKNLNDLKEFPTSALNRIWIIAFAIFIFVYIMNVQIMQMQIDTQASEPINAKKMYGIQTFLYVPSRPD